MRIVAWNIRAGGGVRVGAIGRQLARWAPDVAVLGEFRLTPPSLALARALAAGGLGHQRLSVDRTVPARNGLLVAARWALGSLRVGSPPVPRPWLLVQVGAPTPFALGAMHVPNRVTGRKWAYHAAVLALARGWRRGPALLVGDTNSGRPGLDEEVPVFDAREGGWIEALEAAGWRDAFRHLHGAAREYTWYSPNGANGFRLDQAFLNAAMLPRLRGLSHAWGRARPGRRPTPELSDHAALIVELETRPERIIPAGVV